MAVLDGHLLANEFVLHCCAVTSAIAAGTKSAAQRAGRGDWYGRSESYSASDRCKSLSSVPK